MKHADRVTIRSRMTDVAGENSNARAPLFCAVIAVLVAAVAGGIVMASMGGRVSALVRMAQDDPIARVATESDPNFALYADEHYDGIYFYAIARDPFATGEEHELIDLPGARYGHVLYGWAAGLLSLGRPQQIPAALFVLNLASMGIAAWAVSVLARDMGWSPWAGLLVAVNPGFLYAVTVDTSEVFGSALVALFLLAWFRQQWALAAVLVVASCLAKELFLFVPGGIAAWELLQWLRRRGAPDLVRRIALLSLGPLALAAWEIYLRSALGYWAFKDDLFVLTAPFAGWLETFALATRAGRTSEALAVQIAAASLPLLLAVGVALVVGVVAAYRLRGPLDVTFLGMAALSFCLTWRNLFFAKDMIRQMAPVFLVLVAVVARPRAGSTLERQLEAGRAGPP